MLYTTRSKSKRAISKIMLRALFCLVMVGLIVPRGIVLAATDLPAPTLLTPATTTESKPLIRGLTKNGTDVAVYIDGRFFGKAKTKDDKSGTASFAYVPFLHLKAGMHTVEVRAEAKDQSGRSKASKKFSLRVQNPYPAPTLFTPVVKTTTEREKPYITGVAKSNSLIKVYIDGKLDGQFPLSTNTWNNSQYWVKTVPNSISSFAYQPFLPLNTAKKHLIYATATDRNGKESPFSNVIGFKADTSLSYETTSTDDTTAQGSTSSAESTAKSSSTEATTETKKDENSADSSNSSSTSAAGTTKNSNGNTNAASNTNSDKKNENKEAAGATDSDNDKGETKNSNLVLWLVVIAIVIIIVVTRLTSRPADDENQTGGGQKKLFTEGEKGSGSNINVASSDTKSGSDTPTPPPPPPPATRY